jgi:UDP-N-acetylglucosamine enolpyruvyl transferase
LDDDDDTSSKLNDDIAIKEATSLFSSPHCLMTKSGMKVKVIPDLNDVDVMMMMLRMLMVKDILMMI